MAFRLDVANNWIRVDLVVDMNYHEESADYLVKMMNNYAPRACIKIGTTVRLSHLEMSASMFDRVVRLQEHFPAFRVVAYRALRSRNILGTLCGHTVHRNDKLPDCVHFQYMDILVRDTDAMIDPAFINHPKGAPSPFVYS